MYYKKIKFIISKEESRYTFGLKLIGETLIFPTIFTF